MTRVLDHDRRGPDRARRLVILLHGYGADGQDLLGLSEPLAPHLPDTAFIAPDAPERCTLSPQGHQWFPIPWIDGSTEEAAEAGMARAAADLHAFLDRVMAEEGVEAQDVALLGFSQGTMMALEVAPRREEAVAGIAAFSGRLLRPEALETEALVRPPVLLLHGDADDVVPPQSLREAAEGLQAAGWSQVFAHVMKGTGHGIAPDGLEVALAFLRDVLDLDR